MAPLLNHLCSMWKRGFWWLLFETISHKVTKVKIIVPGSYCNEKLGPPHKISSEPHNLIVQANNIGRNYVCFLNKRFSNTIKHKELRPRYSRYALRVKFNLYQNLGQNDSFNTHKPIHEIEN